MTPTVKTTTRQTDPLARYFSEWRAAGRAALIPYLTAGYPSPADTPELLRRVADGGADILELGVPFSDPLADGPTIQRSSKRAIDAGSSLAGTLDALAEFRTSHDTPVILFTYLNPVLAYGTQRFLADAETAGAHGVLITDLPADSDPALEAELERSPLALVRLIAPTTLPARATEIARRAQGFVYFISRTGVTGASGTLREELAGEVASLRQATTVPIAVGFGVSTAEQAAAVARLADGVVVGSALIDVLDRGGADAAEAFVRSLRAAIDAA